jgi:hypothetical protein
MLYLLTERAEINIRVRNSAMCRNTVVVLTKHRLDTSGKRMVTKAEVNSMSDLGFSAIYMEDFRVSFPDSRRSQALHGGPSTASNSHSLDGA